MKTLIVYYSAEGHTKKIAKEMASALGADIFEIVPDPIYTARDLDWTNPDSRCSRENDEPELRDVNLVSVDVPGWDEYERVIIGYPIWWGIAAWPVNSFVKSVDWGGKIVIPFCTSHSSGLGDSDLLLHNDANGGDWKDGTRFFQDASEEKVRMWCEEL